MTHRRLMAFSLALVMALLCLLPAMAQDDIRYTGGLGDIMDRVKLRSQPNTDANVIGQYYAGVKVLQINRLGAWSEVEIYGRRGYMMNRFLKLWDDGRAPGLAARVAFADMDNRVPVYNNARSGQKPVAWITPDSRVFVLATVGQDHLHVLVRPGPGDEIRPGTETPDGVIGFVKSDVLVREGVFSTVLTSLDQGERTLAVRSAPESDAPTLLRMYDGTKFHLLFDDHVNGDGFARVRLGHVVGFVKEGTYASDDGGLFPTLPPLGEALQDPLKVYARSRGSEKALTGDISADTPFQVLGEAGNRYLIRFAKDNNFLRETGFVDKAAIKAVSRAVSTDAIIKEEVTGEAYDSMMQPLGKTVTLNKGLKVAVPVGEENDETARLYGERYVNLNADSVIVLIYGDIYGASFVKVPPKVLKIDDGFGYRR